MSASFSCGVGFTWSPMFEEFDYGRKHPLRKGRFFEAYDFLNEEGFLGAPQVSIIEAEPISEELLTKIHSQEYISFVQQVSETGEGDIDIDTPGFKGIYDNARIQCGATMMAVTSTMNGDFDHCISPTGGFHHAKFSEGGGFCIFNDIAAAVEVLKNSGTERILIADFDAHHGNGTQEYFYEDSSVMQISFHEDPEWMYPHDGYIKDIGAQDGEGFNVNMPFPMDSGDDVYLYAFERLVPPLIEAFNPQVIIYLPGFDNHYLDPLTHMVLTTKPVERIAQYLHDTAHDLSDGTIIALGAGGYNADAYRWGLGVVFSKLSGYVYAPPPQKPPFEDNKETWDIVKERVSKVRDLVFPIHGL